MAQSTYDLAVAPERPLHVAIILDGNGRWAERRGWPRAAGHREGAEAVRRIVAAAPALGVGTLTLFAFSADNWRRPRAEVRGLFRLLGRYLMREARECVRNGVRLSFPGRRDRLPVSLARSLAEAEQLTAGGRKLRLRIAVDYSGRDTILAAAALATLAAAQAGDADGGADRAAFLAAMGRAANEREAAPEVDLLIRTGGERRLSDFLLFECAYAELEFLDRAWPDFRPADLAECLDRFSRRERRFGGLSPREA
jgi:undecaprenyl diphosphate synthase